MGPDPRRDAYLKLNSAQPAYAANLARSSRSNHGS